MEITSGQVDVSKATRLQGSSGPGRLCPYWSKKDTGAEYSQRCPLGLRCPYSHGAKDAPREDVRSHKPFKYH